MKRNSADAFWRRVDRSGECWIWTGRTTATGYGHFDIDGRVLRAHRFSFALSTGSPIPVGMSVCHRCDNRRCVRPGHLFLGSHVDNMRDMAAKGRAPARLGVKNCAAKLTADDVARIRSRLAMGDRQTDLARAFGVTQANVSSIARGLTWKGASDAAG